MHQVPAGVAQQAEQPSCKRQVSGSTPLTGSESGWSVYFATVMFAAGSDILLLAGQAGRGAGNISGRHPALFPAAAAGHYCPGMSRLPGLRRDALDAGGQAVWDGVVGSRGDQLVNAEGGLIGPFNAFVHAPEVGKQLSSLGRVIRFGTSIERRLSEIAIITVGARWKAEFEWWAHARMAREHGVAGAVVDAIGNGTEPPFEADDERTVHAAARQLAETGRLDQGSYDRARQLLGDAGMVELVSLCGYYTLISFLLNAFAVPLPPGATPAWENQPAASPAAADWPAAAR